MEIPPVTDSQASADSSAELLRHVVAVLVRDHLQINGFLGEIMAGTLFDALCRRFGGQQLYIPVEDVVADRHARIVALFNGRNHHEVCRQVGISRATLYRALKLARVKQSHGAPKHETCRTAS